MTDVTDGVAMTRGDLDKLVQAMHKVLLAHRDEMGPRRAAQWRTWASNIAYKSNGSAEGDLFRVTISRITP